MKKIFLFMVLNIFTFSYHNFKLNNCDVTCKVGGWTENEQAKSSFEMTLSDFKTVDLVQIEGVEIISYTNYDSLVFIFDKENFLGKLDEKNLKKYRNKKAIKAKELDFNKNLSGAINELQETGMATFFKTLF